MSYATIALVLMHLEDHAGAWCTSPDIAAAVKLPEQHVRGVCLRLSLDGTIKAAVDLSDLNAPPSFSLGTDMDPPATAAG